MKDSFYSYKRITNDAAEPEVLSFFLPDVVFFLAKRIPIMQLMRSYRGEDDFFPPDLFIFKLVVFN